MNATTRRMLACAGAGSLLGFVLAPVLGAIPGFLAGVYLFERVRLGRHADAVAALRTVMRAGGSGILAELFTCQLIAAAWVSAVFWG
jgi:LytS/YehU family sensor histidine kinase